MYKSLLLLFSLFVLTVCQAQVLDASYYSITNWQDGKRSATVFTFDDWSPGQKTIVAPTLVAKQIKATLFITTQDIWSSSEYDILNNAVSHGIEVANHTVHHPDLTSLTLDSLHQEVSIVTNLLNANVTGQQVNTFAYPFGNYNADVISEVKQQLIAARTVNRPVSGHWNYNFAQTIDDYYKLSTVSIDPTYTPANLDTDIEAALSDGGLITFLIHSVYNSSVDDHWFNPLSETQLDDLLDELVTYKNQTWITSLSEAVRYHKERASAQLTLVSNDFQATILQLNDTLSNDALYNIPLTIKFQKYDAQGYLDVSQDGQSISYSYSSNGDSIIFNATPDGGEIRIQKYISVGTKNSTDDQSGIAIWPVPAQHVLNVASKNIQGKFLLTISDLKGTKIKSVEMNLDGTNNTSVNIDNLSPGMYTVTIQNDLISHSQKIIIANP